MENENHIQNLLQPVVGEDMTYNDRAKDGSEPKDQQDVNNFICRIVYQHLTRVEFLKL